MRATVTYAVSRSTIARQVRADGVCSAARVAPHSVPDDPAGHRPDRLDFQVQADAGDLDVERFGNRRRLRQLEPQAAIRHVDHRSHEFRGIDRLAHQLCVVAVRLEIDQRIVVAGNDDHTDLRLIRPGLHHQVQPVERFQADVGDQQVVGADGQEALGRVVGRRTGDVVPCVAQELNHPGKGMLVIIEDEDSKR